MVVRDAHGSAFHVLHEAIEVVARMGDAYNTNRCPVPQFSGIQFRNGNVEARAKAVFQAAHNLSTILERLCSLDVDFKREECDWHGFDFPVCSFRVAGIWPAPESKLQTRKSTILRDHFSRDPLRNERFDHVVYLDIAIICDRDAAFHAVSDFFGVIFESSQ